MPIANVMNLSPEILQFLGSLVAILAVAGLAWWMGLGGRPRLNGEADGCAAANEAVDGYIPTEIAVDSRGLGAVMQDEDGRILVLKPHGNKFAGRILTQAASAEANSGALTVISGERRYGSVSIAVGNSEAWADRINAIENTADA